MRFSRLEVAGMVLAGVLVVALVLMWVTLIVYGLLTLVFWIFPDVLVYAGAVAAAFVVLEVGARRRR